MADIFQKQSIKGGLSMFRRFTEVIPGYHAPNVWSVDPGVVWVRPTVTTDTVAHAAGDTIGGKITITDAINQPGKSGMIGVICITDADNQKPVGNFIFFDSDPSGSTLTQNTAPVIVAADQAKVLGQMPVVAGDWVTVNGIGYCTVKPVMRVKLAASTTNKNLYAIFVVSAGTPTFTNPTTKFLVSFGIEQHV